MAYRFFLAAFLRQHLPCFEAFATTYDVFYFVVAEENHQRSRNRADAFFGDMLRHGGLTVPLFGWDGKLAR